VNSIHTTALALLLALVPKAGAGGLSQGEIKAVETAPTKQQPTSANPNQSEPAPAQAARVLADAPLEPDRAALLDLAFSAASKVPTMPHARTRTKLQESVVAQSFELGQWERGLNQCASIDDWRRGVLLTAYAEACLDHNKPQEAERVMAEVRGLAKSLVGTQGQDWQVARILGRLGELQVRQGLPVEVDAELLKMEKAEAIGMRRAYAAQASAAELDGILKPLEAAYNDADFEDMLALFAVCQELYARFYAQPEIRARVDSLLHDSWSRMPYELRVEQLLGFADAASSHKDSETALQHLNEADEILAGTAFNMQTSFPLIGRLAADLHRAGEAERGQKWITQALAKYDAENPLLSQVFRAGCLRPLAEAQVRMGQGEAANLLYWRVVEVGAENVNARPRVEDLVATCLSMVETGFAPEEKLANRLRTIAAGLEDPW
jgi:hypothetical protein